MTRSPFIRGGVALVILSLAGFGGWLISLPTAPVAAEAPPVPRQEADAMLASLEPTRRERPLVAVIGINDATETTDYLVPTGILRRADVADVLMLATGPGPVRLYPALVVEPDAAIAAFDEAHPEGADYVIVPAMSRDDDPAVIAWLRGQAQKGATIIGICAGVKVVGTAGLLDGKRATTHWYYLGEMLRRSPTIALTVLANRVAFWNREAFGVRVEPGMDEVSLALVADAWSRTYRSNVTTYAASTDAVQSRNGVRFIPDLPATQWPEDRRLSTFSDQRSGDVLDQALDAIASRYGRRTAHVVAMQLEYPRQSRTAP